MGSGGGCWKTAHLEISLRSGQYVVVHFKHLKKKKIIMPFSLDLYFILLNPNCEFTGKELVANFHKLATFTQN